MQQTEDLTSLVETRGPLPEELPVPAHVPPELVMEPLGWEEANARIDPFSVTEDALSGLPPIFHSPKPVPGYCRSKWVVTHHDDIRRVYEDAQLYSTKDLGAFNALVGETFPMIPMAIDPPEHSKYRRLLNPLLSPVAINKLDDSIRATVNGLIDGFVDKGECDAAYDFGRLYPVQVFLRLMGFPLAKLEDFLSWEYAILHSFDDLEKVQWGIRNAIDWLRSFISETRKNPGDNFTSHIINGQVEGRNLTEDEVMGIVTFLWIGGLDTVAATTSLMFRRLALQPELQEQLRENPDLINNAVEEFLRTQPLVNSMRLIKKDHSIRGVEVKAGDYIQCANIVGNFDPEKFEDSRHFRLDRASNRHFSFGGGPHVCLGIHLARRELRIALGEFLRRIPPFRMQENAQIRAFPGLIAAPSVPIIWDKALAE